MNFAYTTRSSINGRWIQVIETVMKSDAPAEIFYSGLSAPLFMSWQNCKV